jgi:hypothetical protein
MAANEFTSTKEDIMMRRQFFMMTAATLGMTLVLPLVSGRARAWADDHDRKSVDNKSDDRRDDHRREDDDEENRKVTICEHGDTERVKVRQLPEELREGATLGRCHASPDR